MVSENINKDFFKEKVELFKYRKLENGMVEREAKGTIQIFEEWLTSLFSVTNGGTVPELFKPLKVIRRERQNPAHRIDENENEYDQKFIEKQKEIMHEIYCVFRNFRNIFHQHPDAKSFKIPDILENVNIKMF